MDEAERAKRKHAARNNGGKRAGSGPKYKGGRKTFTRGVSLSMQATWILDTIPKFKRSAWVDQAIREKHARENTE